MTKLYTPSEVAEILRISRSLVYDLIQEGTIAIHRISRGKRGPVRISEDDLQEYLAGCRIGTKVSTRTSSRKLKHIRV